MAGEITITDRAAAKIRVLLAGAKEGNGLRVTVPRTAPVAIPPERETRVLLTVGNKVVYPSQGPCLIGPIVKKVVDGRAMSFYPLVQLGDCGVELFVPVDKAEIIGARLLLERSEIPKLLDHLKNPVQGARSWQRRAMDNVKLLASGSAFDLAEIVQSLTVLSRTKSLLPRDSLMLERARKLLVCEISEVMGETKSAAEEQIDRALHSCKETTQP